MARRSSRALAQAIGLAAALLGCVDGSTGEATDTSATATTTATLETAASSATTDIATTDTPTTHSTSTDSTATDSTTNTTTDSTTDSTDSTGSIDPCAPDRVDFDRPDDTPGAYQIHVNYVLPSDGVDEMLDLDGRIVTSVGAFTQWFAAQAEGRRLRLDTCGGALDVRLVRLTQSEAELKAKGLYLRDAIEAEMAAAGLLAPTKMELVYYGGDADGTCGGGPFPPALIGRVAAIYLKGTFADPKIPSCAENPIGASLEEPGYFDFAALHELLHGLGMAPVCAPHAVLDGHVSDSPTDLMYAGGSPWTPAVLDLGRDDYFDHGDPMCPDLARSVFLEPLPADAEVPPGW